MQHGDMLNMLYRVREQGNATIPNRVLWSFFLCRKSPGNWYKNKIPNDPNRCY